MFTTLPIAGADSGDDYTIPLCPWHHRAVPHALTNPAHMEFHYGPSLAMNKRLFNKRYGTEIELLAKVNQMIGVMR